MKTKKDIQSLINANELDGDLSDIYKALVGDFGLMEGEKMKSVAKELGEKYANVKSRVDDIKGYIKYLKLRGYDEKSFDEAIVSKVQYLISRAFAEGYRKGQGKTEAASVDEKEAIQYAITILREELKKQDERERILSDGI